jgi:hypothetical protein
VQEYLAFFLRAFIERIQPPIHATANSSMTSKLSRQLLKNFIEDLLQLLYAPEFPIAEQLLFALTSFMVNLVDPAVKASTTSQVSDRFKMSCVGMLALIAIHLKRHAALAAENPMKIRPKVELVDPTESEDGSGSHLAAVARGPEVLHCVCGVHREYASLERMEQDESIGMTVDCDECHVFYHSRCIGLREREIAELTGWHCENCILRMECARQTKELMHKREKLNALAASATASESGSSSSKKKKARSSSLTSAHAALTTASSLLSELESELPSLDSHESAKVGSAVLRQLLMNYLDKEIVGSGEETMLFARQYILCSWMHQAKMADDQRRAVEARNAEKAGATPAAAAISSALSTTVSPSFERDLSLVQLNFEPARSSATAKLDIASSAAASSHAGSLLPPEMAGAQRKWINREMIVRIGRQLSAEKPMSLQHLPVRILVALCNRCSDPSPKFRSCAVSAVADLVRVDPIVLKEPRVKGTLMKRLTDSSISTREAVVDLIGTHILQAQQEQAKQERQSQQQQQAMVKQENGTKGAPASSASAAAASPSAALSSKYSLDADYFTFVLKSLADPGISVRKKVVRVMRDLCLQQGKLHPRIVDMVERVISCVRDSEESMQSLAVTIVYEMWFDRGSERIKERVATSSGGGSKVTKDEPQIYLQDAPHLLASSPFTPAFQQQVQLIVAVIHRLSQTVGGVSMTDGVESLTDILLLLLEQESSLAKNTSAGGEMTSLTGLKMNLLKLSREQKKRQQSRASTFQNAINNSDKSSKRSSGAAARAAVDTCSIRAICVDIVKGVIQLLMNTGNAAPAASSSSVAGPLPPLSRLSCLQTLHVFSQVDPSLLLLHIHTLLPYLGLGQPVDVEARRREGRTKEEIDEEVRRYQATVGPDTQCVLLLLEIYREVLYLVDSPMAAANPELADQLYRLKADVAFTQKLKDDVTAILFRTQQPVLVKAAVPTLAMIAQKTNNGELIAKTIKTFVGYLWTHQGHARTPNPNQTRALISVGLLVKHFDIEAFYASSERSSASAAGTVVNGFWQDIWKHCAETWPAFKQTPDLLRRSTWMLEANPKKQANICDQIFNLYRLYLRAASTAGPPAAAAAGPSLTASKESQPAAGGKTIATQAHCLRAIIAMFSRKPTLIPQAKEVIDICLSPNPAAHELQRQALQCLREFLQNEDRRLQRTQREDRMKAKTTRKKSAGAAGGKGKKGAAKQEEDGEGEEDVDIEDEQSESMTDQSTIGSSPGHRKQQASWTDSSIDASDFLPPMVAMCEKHVYQLAMSSSPHVRAEALQFMHVFLSQAVTNPIDAMPSLIAAFTDRQPWVNKCAMTILHELIANKKEYLRFLEQRFADGLKLSYGMQARLVKVSRCAHALEFDCFVRC